MPLPAAPKFFRVAFSPAACRGIYYGTSSQVSTACGGQRIFYKNEPTEAAARAYFAWKLPALPVPNVQYL